jgi:predicted nucleic acid-binding protein
MKVVVQDASILIDLAEGELLEAWFSLGIETLTTSLVWREVNRRSHKSRLKRFTRIDKLEIVSINSEAMTEVVVLRRSLPANLTLQDASVLHLAHKCQAILLAGDDLLRKAAAERDVVVRGLLWVLDELVGKQAITPTVAAATLERLLKGKSRLPKAECEVRLRKWRS